MAVRVCFVCLGNICRSPTAAGVMRRLVADAGLEGRIEVDSAGTAAVHAGEPADERSAAAARARGIELDHVARAFARADFGRFDYVVAMDRDNRRALRALATGPDQTGRIALLRDYEAGARGLDVPDPYYGGADGFDRVLEICESACAALLAHIRGQHGLGEVESG
jgi:low molecular weight protein-tyrosine phosphatase